MGKPAKYGVDDAIHVFIDFVIPQTQGLKSIICKMLVTNTVSRLSYCKTMLGSVDLDDSACDETRRSRR